MPKKWIRATIGLAASIIILGILLHLVPKWQIPSEVVDHTDRAELENEYRRTLAQVMLGILVLGGAYLTWRRVKAAEQAVTVSQEQQITERFTRAIEQLGNQDMAIRLGGIYALERIARDSPGKDQRQVVEVLTAYLRENARWEKLKDSISKGTYQMSTDFQAILMVLGRREPDDLVLDLSRTYLKKANLHKAQLAGANFYLANLSDSNLSGANLDGAFLNGADLSGTNLTKTSLVGAYLEQANPFDVDEETLPHIYTNLTGAQLVETNLKNAHLRYAHFRWASIDGADFSDADLTLVEGLLESQLASAKTSPRTILP